MTRRSQWIKSFGSAAGLPAARSKGRSGITVVPEAGKTDSVPREQSRSPLSSSLWNSFVILVSSGSGVPDSPLRNKRLSQACALRHSAEWARPHDAVPGSARPKAPVEFAGSTSGNSTEEWPMRQLDQVDPS